MRKGFIVMDGDSYVGTGNFADVLSAVAELMATRAVERDMALERVEQANVAKTNFLASMSHELRTPLNAILGFADLVRKETYGEMSPPNYRDYVEDIYQSGQHLLSMINEILDMAKIEAGHFEISEDVFDMEITLSRVTRMMREAAAKAQISLSSQIPEHGLPLVRAGERHFQQIILNILSNAIKFTEAGGAVTLDTRLNENGDVLLVITDTGIGIDPSMIEKVFDPFEQVESSLTRTRAGTGLGLPLARAMTEAYGGTLYLTSEVGCGTRVVVLLPAHRVCHDWSATEAAKAIFVA
jgi:two-component system cell cycle sensor histidine kinase PleC